MDELAGTEWRREGEAIVRDLEFEGLRGGDGHVNRVADLVEQANTTRTSSSASPSRRTPRAA